MEDCITFILFVPGERNMSSASEFVIKFCKCDSGFFVNERFVKYVGLNSAVVLGAVIAKYEQVSNWRKSGIRKDDRFFFTVSDMEQVTGLTKYLQAKAISKLSNSKLVDQRIENTAGKTDIKHDKRYFKINWVNIQKFLIDGYIED